MQSKMNLTHKIALITFCYNESKIMPFVIDYWKKFVTHVYVFDDSSTDNSIKELSKYDWITIINFSHLKNEVNKIDDIVYMNIKNNFWKTIKHNYDWIVICDFDECLYFNKNIDNILYIFEKYNINCICPKYFNMITENFPEYEKGKLFHEKYNTCENINNEDKKWFNKMLLFNPKKIINVNYEPGAHFCNPIEYKKLFTECDPVIASSKLYYINDIHCYHLHFLGIDFLLNKYNNSKNRMSEKQINYRLGIHYMQENEKLINDFNKKWNNHLTI